MSDSLREVAAQAQTRRGTGGQEGSVGVREVVVAIPQGCPISIQGCRSGRDIGRDPQNSGLVSLEQGSLHPRAPPAWRSFMCIREIFKAQI